MPYITPEERKKVDKAIDALIYSIVETSDENRAGTINYAVTKILRAVYPRRYRYINEAVGILECIKQEYYRTEAAPYEDLKKYENGDIDLKKI